MCTGSARESVGGVGFEVVREVRLSVSCVRLPPVSFYRYRVLVAKAQPSVRWLRPLLTRVARDAAPCVWPGGSHDFRPRLPLRSKNVDAQQLEDSHSLSRAPPVWPLR